MTALAHSIRIGIGLLYLFAGLGKAGNPPSFYSNILDYSLPVSDFFLVLVAITLPWLEILLGIFLLFGFWLNSTLLVTLVLNLLFLGLTGQAWLRGLEVSCGCFGAFEAGGPLAGLIQMLERPSWATLKNTLTLVGLGWIMFRSPIGTVKHA